MRVNVGVDAGRRAGDEAAHRGDRRAVDTHFAIARDPRQPRLRAGGQLADVLEKERPAPAPRPCELSPRTDSRSAASFAGSSRTGPAPPNSSRSTPPMSAAPQSITDERSVRAAAASDAARARPTRLPSPAPPVMSVPPSLPARAPQQLLDAGDRGDRPTSSTAPDQVEARRAERASANSESVWSHGFLVGWGRDSSFAPSLTATTRQLERLE